FHVTGVQTCALPIFGYLTCGIVEEDDSVPHGMIANTFCCDPPHLRRGLAKVNLSAYGKQPGEVQPGAATKVHHHRTINLTGKIRLNGLSHDSIARICSDQTVIVRGDNVIVVGCSGHPCKVSPHKNSQSKRWVAGDFKVFFVYV